jgi:hypothetical protein
MTRYGVTSWNEYACSDVLKTMESGVSRIACSPFLEFLEEPEESSMLPRLL